MRFRFFYLLPLLLLTQSAHSAPNSRYLKADESVPASELRVSNQHPFVIREPVKFQLPADLLKSQNLLAVSHSVSGGTVEAHYLPVQITKTDNNNANASIDIQLRPGESRVYTFQEIGSSGTATSPAKITETGPGNLPLQITTNGNVAADLFELALIETDSKLSSAIEEAIQNRLTIDFKLLHEDHGPVKNSFLYTGEAHGDNDYEIEIAYDLFSSGMVDISLQLKPKNVRNSESHLAIAKTFPSTKTESAFYQTDGKTALLEQTGQLSEPLNWLSWGNSEQSENRALLIEPTAAHEKAIGLNDQWIALTEIPGLEITKVTTESIHLHYRLLPSQNRSSAETNEAFTSFAGVQERSGNEDEFHISFGSSGVRFGFDYSPHTIFGDDWKKFSAEIERDFRIANAIGFEWIRIENRAEISSNGLTNLANLARTNGLKLYLSGFENREDLPAEAADEIGFIEIPSEIISKNSDSWPNTIAELRNKNARLQIATTTSPSTFPTIPRLDFAKIDAISQTINGSAETSKATIANDGVLLGGYATRNGKMPIAGFENLEFSLNTSDQAQANEFYFRLDALLANGSVALLHSGKLVPISAGENPIEAPKTFPLLHLDRTPKTQGLAMHSLINRYGDQESPAKTLKIELQLAQLRPGETTRIPVSIRNLTNRELELELTPRLPAGLTTESASKTMSIGPRERITYEHLSRADDDLAPGFYHIFEEVHFDENVRFGWSYLSNRSRPALDRKAQTAPNVEYSGGLDALAAVNFANIRYAIFGAEAPEEEILSANRLQEKLRKRTGAAIQRIADDEITAQEQSRSLLLVGTLESNSKIAEFAPLLAEKLREFPAGDGIVTAVEHPENPNRFLLIVSGGDTAGVKKAASDLLRRL